MHIANNAELLKINSTEEQPVKRPNCPSWLYKNDLSSSVTFLVSALNMFIHFILLKKKTTVYSKEIFIEI